MPKPVSQQFLSDLGRTIEHGAALHRQGKLAEAEKIYTRVLKTLPQELATLQLLARLKIERGKAGEAFRLMTTAVAAHPQSAEAHIHLGVVLRELKRHADALASFDKALALAPDDVEALGNRGDILLSLGRAAEAVECLDRILARSPDEMQARALRGAALAALGRFEEALKDLDAVLAVAPNSVVALYNRAGVLAASGRLAEALAAYDRVVALAPQHATAWMNRGTTLTALNRHRDAMGSFTKAIAARPDYAEAYFNRALASLAIGDLAGGFRDYEWRWRTARYDRAKRSLGRPLWLGEFPLGNRTILLHAEQGLGDTIQFARYIPMLARAGATVVLEARSELIALLRSVEGTARIIPKGEPLPPFDVHCPLASLPLAFKTDSATIPATIPYLFASEDRLAKWRPRLESLERPRIALAWAGNPTHINDRNRSLALSQLSPLWAAGSRLVSVQREVRPEDADLLHSTSAITHLGGDLEDLADTAAVIASCDLVIAVDTAVAHLAAAMGRAVWILLPFSPDWRWTVEGTQSPWYPAARLFRQPQPGDWASVIAQVGRELPVAALADSR